jgi:hypothetical protein
MLKLTIILMVFNCSVVLHISFKIKVCFLLKYLSYFVCCSVSKKFSDSYVADTNVIIKITIKITPYYNNYSSIWQFKVFNLSTSDFLFFSGNVYKIDKTRPPTIASIQFQPHPIPFYKDKLFNKVHYLDIILEKEDLLIIK